MKGIRDLSILLRQMKPKIIEGEFVFCLIQPGEASKLVEPPLMTFNEEEGLTVIIPKDSADNQGLQYDEIWRMITLTVHSSLSAVGLLAAVTDVLAKNGIPVNTVSAFYHDHLFIPTKDIDHAFNLLLELSEKSS